MIHIATIHWKSSVWVDLQMSMFRKHIQAPFTTYAYCTDIERSSSQLFDFVLDDGDPSHSDKLDALSHAVLSRAADNDIIIFIDGDAFPVASLDINLGKMLSESPLVAIQRLENLGEKHAHPCFCATTVKFWRELNGNWQKGYHWINSMNLIETDVGGELLRVLTEKNIKWMPLHRTNTHDIIPVCFGIYGDLIYHHGAGFRGKEVRGILHAYGVFDTYKRLDARILNNITPRKYLKWIRNSQIHPEGRLKRRAFRDMEAIEQSVKSMLLDSPEKLFALLRPERF